MRRSQLAWLLLAPLPLLAAAPAVRAQDAAQGELVFKHNCAICHTVEAGKNKIGPSLAGIVGRKSGAEAGFTYSDGMSSAGLTWDEATLDKYLANPREVVPGNKMMFPGVKNPDERRAIIAYLKTLKS